MVGSFVNLNVAIVGGGLGGLSAAISLRRAGHTVTVYERRDFAGEVGAGIGIPSNGSKWLYKWGVDIEAGKPVVMSKLIIHKWGTGEVVAIAPLGNYKEKFGYETLGFQRCDLHGILLNAALSEEGVVDAVEGMLVFENGERASADLVIAADGLFSRLRTALGIIPEIQQASSCAYRHVISTDKVKALGLESIGSNDAIEFWNGTGGSKIVIGACHGGGVLGMYSFFPADTQMPEANGWDVSVSPQQLVATFPDLDSRVHQLMLHSEDIKIWRLYIHEPYQYWARGRVALLGDAAHPMLPDQTQGHSQAIEDAAALGLIFSKQYFAVDENEGVGKAIDVGLQRYEKVRMSRVTTIQIASTKARKDMRERIGWEAEGVKPGKLTIEDLCGYDMEAHLSEIVGMK